MRRFQIPFKFEREFLNKIDWDLVHSIYFPIYSLFPSSARIELYDQDLSLLNEIPKEVEKHLILNSKIVHPAFYTKDFLNSLNEYVSKFEIDKIVVADGMFLKFLVENTDDVKFILSSNMKIDTLEIFNFMKTVYGSKIDDTLILHRDFNYDMDLIKRASKITLILVVNEGCIFACPFKDQHDFIISGINYSMRDMLSAMYFNQKWYDVYKDFACLRVYEEKPWLILTSPFIRPEDLKFYPDNVVFKIAKRTASLGELLRTVNAYFKGEYFGNLTDILDNTGPSSWWIPNEKIPDSLFLMKSKCRRDCENCRFCSDLFSKISRKIS